MIAKQEKKTLWDKRYDKEGAVWGWNPSQTVELLSEDLKSVSHVLEVGFGYGRDLVSLAQGGHKIMGIEESTIGLSKAVHKLKSFNLFNKVHLLVGEFRSARIQNNDFDAVFSHRMLHLLGDTELVKAFRTAAVRVLRPGGLFYVSARDFRDFDEEQMDRLENGCAVYKDTVKGREGHVISFWDEDRFRKTFSKQFNIKSFTQGEEIESMTNQGKLTHYTIMMAERKFDI